MDSDLLKTLSKSDVVALILAQQVQVAAQAVQIGVSTARIAEPEGGLSEGAIANLLARAKTPLLAAAAVPKPRTHAIRQVRWRCFTIV